MKSLFILTLVFIGTLACAADKPNIIYILVDDLGYGDLGCYGQKMLTTPNLDRMAAEGMKFTRHYSGSTVCAPSRCVLMTGLHTGHCRVRGNDPWIIPDGDVTVPSLLKTAGYHTACIGKFGLGKPLPLDDPQRKGFDEFFGYVGTSHAHNFYTKALIRNGAVVELPNMVIEGSFKNAQDYKDSDLVGTGVAPLDGRKAWVPQLLADDVQRYLGERAKAKAPFFLYYAMNVPHTNNEAGKNSPLGHGMECPDYGEFKDKDWPDAEKGFAALIRFLDNEVGRITTRLKELGIDKNTLVMFSSDNGPHHEGGHDSDFFNSNGDFKGTKRDMTDGGIRVPLIAWWPGKVKSGEVSEHVSGFQDLLPTVAELSGAKLTAETDGISFVPTLLGNDGQKQHTHLFWDFNEQGGKRAVLKWPWKLIHLNTGTAQKAPKGKAKGKALEKLLHNLETDIGEEKNLAAEKPEIVAELEKLMQQSWRTP
ncbi:arylsulfatase [Prosthecobacter sp.]|uniref:arylsulfatase n=1 Tax=Prosthecobacter sp. TaxID=1965333 RepID=UPI002AB9B67F|nr:arylsulfatase [Prosthecobacter sp.]MDZ4404261.1 arylsulfatase [Prosthecobacter sp.]